MNKEALKTLKLPTDYLNQALIKPSASARPIDWYDGKTVSVERLDFPKGINNFAELADVEVGDPTTVSLTLKDTNTNEYYSMTLRNLLSCRQENSEGEIVPVAQNMLASNDGTVLPEEITFKSATNIMVKWDGDENIENKRFSIFAYKAFQDAVKDKKALLGNDFTFSDVFDDQEVMNACDQSQHKEPLALDRAKAECLKEIIIA